MSKQTRRDFLEQSMFAAAAAALLVFGVGLVSYARTNPLIILLLIIPSLICAAGVIGVGHNLWPRFFFFTCGFGALTVVRGTVLLGDATARLLKLPPEKSGLLGTALCVGIILLSATSIPAVYSPKQAYRGALDFVEARKEPGDTIVAVGLTRFPYKNFYKMNWEVANTLEALDAIRSSAKRTWVIYVLPVRLQSHYPHIIDAIRRDFKVIKAFPGTLQGGTIFVCRSDIPPSSPSTTSFRPGLQTGNVSPTGPIASKGERYSGKAPKAAGRKKS